MNTSLPLSWVYPATCFDSVIGHEGKPFQLAISRRVAGRHHLASRPLTASRTSHGDGPRPRENVECPGLFCATKPVLDTLMRTFSLLTTLLLCLTCNTSAGQPNSPRKSDIPLLIIWQDSEFYANVPRYPTGLIFAVWSDGRVI